MCRNVTCPFKGQCYRFNAKPSEFLQSYADFKPYTNADDNLVCDYFMDMFPIHKFNNGLGATLCHKCRVIISEGLTKDLYCKNCI